jgi:signal transduction histidine kinase
MPDRLRLRLRRRASGGRPIITALRTLVLLCWGVLLIVCLTVIGTLQVQSENVRQLTLVDGPAVDANSQILQAMTDARTGLNAYQLSGDRGLLQPYFGAQDRTIRTLATLHAKVMLGGAGSAEAARDKTFEADQRHAVQAWWAEASRREQALSLGRRANAFEGENLFSAFRAANSVLALHLTAERATTRLATRTMSSRGVVISVGATAVALLAMLVLGRRVALTISQPLTELRDTMVRQREGDPQARAREDQGSSELRSVARDFNALTEQNLALQQSQARALDTHRITLAIARAIRAASDTQHALDVMCAALGEGLGADRVVANTLGVDHDLQLGSQWHVPDLAPLGERHALSELVGLAEELWLSAGFRACDDLLEPAAEPSEPDLTLQRETDARAVVMVPIGLDDRVIGIIYVFMVHEARTWTTAEINVVQAVAGFVARAVVEAEHQAHQREHVEQMEKLDRQKSDFLATVSHELRTPLTSITGYLELLQDGDAGVLTGQQHRMLEVIDRNTTRLRSLIEDVLVLSRIEGGVTTANFVGVPIRSLVNRVGEELSLLAHSSDIDLGIDAGPPGAVVLGDWASLDRAVVNVLSNAIKFSRPGGVVSLRAAVDPAACRVLITCQDHGVGIPAQDQADLFTRFFRASNAVDQAIPGTGLGLSIVKQIVEDQHGGELRLTSVEEEGTTVVLDLPLYERPRAQKDEPSRAGADQLPISERSVGNDSGPGDVFDIRA